MTTQLPQDPTGTGLARTLGAFKTQGGMDMAFGGKVSADSSSLAISELCGARTRSLSNLVVRSGDGLGGKSLVLGRPASVTSYHAAQGITHVYDHAVGQEDLETVVALPVVVDSVPRLVIYLGNRSQVGLGDRWFDRFTPMIRRLERDIAVDDEVRRRLGLVLETTLSRADLQEISRELADLAGQIQDEALRAKLEAVRGKIQTPLPPATDVHLAPREIDVLAQIARGHTNHQAAENLGLLPNTVKSYLKTAMRKLHATNRVQAITAARDAGLIR
jgi:LuxR family transcriptional regulator, regulator of acetate metabolism